MNLKEAAIKVFYARSDQERREIMSTALIKVGHKKLARYVKEFVFPPRMLTCNNIGNDPATHVAFHFLRTGKLPVVQCD